MNLWIAFSVKFIASGEQYTEVKVTMNNLDSGPQYWTVTSDRLFITKESAKEITFRHSSIQAVEAYFT